MKIVQYDRKNGTVVVELDDFLDLLANQKDQAVPADYDKPDAALCRAMVNRRGVESHCCLKAGHRSDHYDVSTGMDWR